MSNSTSLNATARKQGGKGVARRARANGHIPATLYGDKKPAECISIEHRDIVRIFKSGRILSTLLDLNIDNQKQSAITRDVQLHPVSDAILHVDFLRLGADATVAVEVAVNFINEDQCPGIRTGGVLNVVRYTVELNCPVDNIPDEIVIDLEGLNHGHSVHISDITLPDGVAPTITDRDFTIATIASPASTVEEEEEVEEGILEDGEEAPEAGDDVDEQEGA